jgi:hypothetical protein
MAYYEGSDGKLLCGVHSKKDKDRVELDRNPDKAKLEEEELERRTEEIEEAAMKRRENVEKGDVIVSKLHFLKKPEYIKGYLNVFPNYKHQNREDGFGCMRLSPKSLGPVDHRMPNLPVAKTIENYHQFAKFWKFELDEEGNILDKYFKARCKAYKNPTPYRHKYSRVVLEKINNKLNKNIPEFSVYYDKDGGEHRYNYLQCRYFYSHYYELLAGVEHDYLKLKEMIENGYNLNICGYDGYSVTTDLWICYNDTSRPFGHELVLYSMLVLDDRKDYPWNRFYRENSEIYKDVIDN